jgi:integrase
MACVRKYRGAWAVDFRDQNGKRHINSNADWTRRDADNELSKITQQLGSGEFQAKRAQKTFAELAQAYIDGHVKVAIRRLTAKDYKGNIDRHLTPYFGPRRVRGISMHDVERFRTALLERGVGLRTINKCLTLLSMMFNYANLHGWMHANPANKVKKLKPERGAEDLLDEKILTPDEVQLLLSKSEKHWRIVIMTAALTGLREGELLGLQWGDIDWNAKQIYVRRTYSGGAFGPPKTESSRQRVEMPDSLARVLKSWKLACPKGEHDLVFPSGAGNPENHSNLLRRGFYPALDRAGLRRIDFHDLRHYCASVALQNGAPITYVSAQLGHASPDITLGIYAHLIPNTGAGIADRLAQLSLGNKMETWTAFGDDLGYDQGAQVIDIRMVARDGIEPPTQGFSVLCSTN